MNNIIIVGCLSVILFGIAYIVEKINKIEKHLGIKKGKK